MRPIEQIERNVFLISCFIPRGEGKAILKQLSESFGITRAQIHHARGTGRTTPIEKPNERDVVEAVVDSEERMDDVFEFLFEKLRINEEPGRWITASRLQGALPFKMPASQ